MEDIYFRKIMATIIFVLLAILSFFILKPILMAIITALILAFIFNPIYQFFSKKTHSKDFSAFLMCAFLIALIVLPFWFLTPLLIDQSFKFYVAAQEIDIITPLKTFFPSLFASEQFSNELARLMKQFIANLANSFFNILSNIILNSPKLLLYSFVVIFTFYFALRDQEYFIVYIKSLLPFSKEIENKLFNTSRDLASSVIYGQVIVGIIQGLIIGVGFFIFKVPNALFLTLFACLTSIIPMLGPFVVWVPVSFYVIIAGNNFFAFGIIIFGLIASTIDNILRPLIVSKRANLPTFLILIGMVGGLFMFGILGFILGPLILAYLIIIIEIFRKGKTFPAFVQTE